MSSSAPKRRLDVRQETSRRAPGKRTATPTGKRIATPTGPRPAGSPRVKSRRKSFRPTPAMLGAFTLIIAGVGAAAFGGTADGGSLNSNYQTISATYTGSGVDDPNADVDVSRSYDREALAEQTKSLAIERENALKDAAEQAQKVSDSILKNRWNRPVAGYHLSARFGQRSGLWSSGVHTGLDFAGPYGSTIVSIAQGTVKSAGYVGAYGNRTIVTLEDGTDVWYCHQSRITASVGQKVNPGDVIGYTGSTGNVTGPHLHLEIRPNGGAPIDPYQALVDHGVTP